MSIFIAVASSLAGWIAGFVSSYFTSYFTDRRKAIHALTGEIESIRSEFSNHAKFHEIHADSLIRLKPLVFAALPYLSRDKQEDARNAWTSYRDLDVKKFYAYGLVSLVAKVISKETGEVVITEQEAVDMMLSKLHDSLSGFLPW